MKNTFNKLIGIAFVAIAYLCTFNVITYATQPEKLDTEIIMESDEINQEENIFLSESSSDFGLLYRTEQNELNWRFRADMTIDVPEGKDISSYKFYVSENEDSGFVAGDTKLELGDTPQLSAGSFDALEYIRPNVDIVLDKVTHNYKNSYIYAEALDSEGKVLGVTNTFHIAPEIVQGVPEEGTTYNGIVFIQYDEDGNWKVIDRLVIHKGEEIRLGLAVTKSDSIVPIPVQDIEGIKKYYKNDLDSYKISAFSDWSVLNSEDLLGYNVKKFDSQINMGTPERNYSYYFEGITETSNTDIYNSESTQAADCYIYADTYNYKNSTKYDCYGWFWKNLPVTVLSAEEGVTYVKHSRIEPYTDKDEAFKAIRDAYRKRLTDSEDGFVICVESGLLGSNNLLDIVYDTFAERNDMLPDEGDYLHYTSGSRTESEWMADDYSYSIMSIDGKICDVITFMTKHITTYEEEQQVDSKVAEILAGPLASVNTDTATNEQKAKAAYDWIVGHVASSGGNRREPLKHTAYNAFINGNATCEGYALAYGRLLRELGVPNKLIAGTDANAHSYNIVLMNTESDGKQYYYYVDTSAKIFKKDYNSFARTQEQEHYVLPKFIVNYISRIKGYASDSNVVDVIDKDGNNVFSTSSILNAHEYIVGELNKQLSASGEYNFTYTPAAGDEKAPHYTIVLNKDVTAQTRGELDFAGSCDSDLSQSDMYYYYFDWDYSAYVDVDLNGHKIALKRGTQYFRSEYAIRANKVYNGTIKTNERSWLYLVGQESERQKDADVANYSSYYDFNVEGLNKLDSVFMLGRVYVDDTCKISNTYSVSVEWGSTIATSFKTTLLMLDRGALLGDVVTDQVNFNNQPSYYYGDVFGDGDLEPNFVVKNLTANKKTNMETAFRLRVKESLSLNGETRYFPSDPIGKINFAIELERTNDKIATFNIAGTLDNRTSNSDWYEENPILSIVSIPLSVVNVSDSSNNKFPMNISIGKIGALKAYIPGETGLKTINNDNINQLISIDDKYKPAPGYNLDLNNNELTFTKKYPKLPGEVDKNASNALYHILYEYDEDGDGYVDGFSRYFAKLDDAVNVIDSIESKLDDGKALGYGNLDYTLEILDKSSNIQINRLPKSVKRLSLTGTGLKSVYIKDTATYPVCADISTLAGSYVYVDNSYYTNGIHTDSNSLSLVTFEVSGKTQVALGNENTYINTLILNDSSKLIVNNPTRVGFIQGNNKSQIILGESTINNEKKYGCLITDGINVTSSDGKFEGTIDFVDMLSASYRSQHKSEGAEIVLKIASYMNNLKYYSAKGYSQHLLNAGIDDSYRKNYVVTAEISKILCSSIKTLTASDSSKYLGISQEAGTTREYTFSFDMSEASSSDILSINTVDMDTKTATYVDDKGNVIGSAAAILDRSSNILRIVTACKSAKEKVAKVTITNETTGKNISEFFISTVSPAWANISPVATVSVSTDTTLLFNVKQVRGIVPANNLYYAVTLKKNSSTVQDTSERIFNTETRFIKTVDEDGNAIDSFAVDVFKTPTGEKVEPGAGCASKMDAIVSVVMVSNQEAAPKSLDDSNIFVKTTDDKSKKIANISTNSPAFADKISLKASKGSIYAGQNDVKLANINFGKSATYITANDWIANGPEGFTFVNHSDNNLYDNGVYFSVSDNVVPGKYDITVTTTPDKYIPNAQPATAKITVNVADTVRAVDASLPSKVLYRNPNKALSAKIKVTAYNQAYAIMKNAKFAYKLYDNTNPDAPVEIVNKNIASVNSSGTVSIGKMSKVSSYLLKVTSASPCIFDNDNKAPTTDVAFDVISSEVKFDDVLVCYDTNDSRNGSVVEGAIPEINANDKIKMVAVNGNKSTYYPVDEELYTVIPAKGAVDNYGNFLKTGNITYTVTSISGYKMTKTVKVNYVNNKKYNLKVRASVSGNYIDFTDKKSDITGKGFSAGEIFVADLQDDNGNNSLSTLTDATVTVKGAKVISNSKKQSVVFQMTSDVVTITVKRGLDKNAISEEYTIINNDLVKTNPSAPTLKIDGSIKAGSDKSPKVYNNYLYKNGDAIVFTLSKPVDGMKSEAGVEGKIKISKSQSSIPDFDINVFGEPVYSETIVKNKTVAVVTVPVNDNVVFTKGTVYKLAFDYYSDSECKNCLTKSSSLVSIKAEDFKPVYGLNAIQTMNAEKLCVELSSKSQGVEKIEYIGLRDFNNKGIYNDFSKVYSITDDGKVVPVVDGGQPVIMKPQYIDEKTKLPKPMEGYVICNVTYENGETVLYTGKITVKW